MPIFKSLLIATLFFACTHAIGADKSPAYTRADLSAASTLRERALSDATGWQLVESLTTEVGARFAGSAGDRAAVVWAEREMKRLGLSNVRTMDVVVPHWIRGEAELAIVSPSPQLMPTLALGGSIGTPEQGIEADAVMVKDIAALTALPEDAVKGRIVFFTNRMERTRDGTGYLRAVAVRSQGPAEAAARGAAAVVIRSIGTGDHRLPHTGRTVYKPEGPRIPALAISNPDADTLERLFAGNKPVRLRLKSSARELSDTRSANVIGEVPGSDRGRQIIILGAHLDSWDPGVGAIDDGAGVAIMMGAAKLIRELPAKPRRTIRVVLFANEEFGTSGSRTYLNSLADELDRHVLGFEADFGAGPVWRLTSRVNPAQLPAVEQIFRALAPLRLARGDNQALGGADLSGLAKLGMPLLSPDLDGINYFDVHHSANDTLRMVDPQALRQSTAAFAVSVWLAAQYAGEWERVDTAKPPGR